MAPEIIRPQRSTQRAASAHLGSVIALDATNYRARVAVGSGTVSALVPSAHRAAQIGDTVQVTWQGGDPVVTDVVTRHAPVSYTASGANLATRSMNTAPPAAVSGTSPSVTKDVATNYFTNTPTITYDGGSFTSEHIAAINLHFSRANTAWAILDDVRELLHGPSGSSGLKAAYASVKDRTDDLQVATNTQTTVLGQVRNVSATYIKTDQKVLGNSQ